jgi:hypothetical protein
MLERVKAESSFRHDIIHGIAVNTAADDPNKIPMLRLLREQTDIQPRQFTASTASIDEAALRAERLAAGAWILAEALVFSP